ncbi:MAG TPA: hypothetical protein VEO53_17610, partial [Candidatus Binatia bacterium]|nr:hypothetical protein [Candidatus Binatia bacterium]
MKNDLFKSLLIVAFTVACIESSVRAQHAKPTEPLKLDLPLHTLKGTPEDLPAGPNIEPPPDVAPPSIEVPKGVTNVAAGKTVTSSVAPYLGELSRITDGKKEAVDDDAVEFRKGTQWVQVDLGQSFAIH